MLSIDVGSKKVSVIEGIYAKDAVSITAYGEIEYTGEVVVNGEIKDRAALLFLINEIIKMNHMNSKSAILTINSTDIISREFKLPNIKKQKLKLLVDNEMIRIIGSDSAFIIDYVLTGVTPENMLAVTAYAVPKDIVESYFNLLKDLKVKPYGMDINANSIYKLLSGSIVNGQSINEGNIIFADIGYSKISMHAVTNGAYRFNRTEVSPFQEFIREIGAINRLDVTSEYMKQIDVSPDFEYENNVMTDTCKYFVYRVSEEIQRYTQYLMLNSNAKTDYKIYIFGGAAMLGGMEAALSANLKIPVEVIKSIDKVNITANCSITQICNAAGALIRL